MIVVLTFSLLVKFLEQFCGSTGDEQAGWMGFVSLPDTPMTPQLWRTIWKISGKLLKSGAGHGLKESDFFWSW
jgi:hypothetical protein